MGQTDGEMIREKIMELLNKFGYRPSSKNVELIFRAHLADPLDRPLPALIREHDHKLER